MIEQIDVYSGYSSPLDKLPKSPNQRGNLRFSRLNYEYGQTIFYGNAFTAARQLLGPRIDRNNGFEQAIEFGLQTKLNNDGHQSPPLYDTDLKWLLQRKPSDQTTEYFKEAVNSLISDQRPLNRLADSLFLNQSQEEIDQHAYYLKMTQQLSQIAFTTLQIDQQVTHYTITRRRDFLPSSSDQPNK